MKSTVWLVTEPCEVYVDRHEWDRQEMNEVLRVLPTDSSILRRSPLLSVSKRLVIGQARHCGQSSSGR